LDEVTPNHTLILPQLGASGVSAHEVRRQSGYTVTYGPVRAEDLGAYLDSGLATQAMRRVRFALRDRAVLIPVELVGVLKWLVLVVLMMYIVSGGWGAIGVALVALAGAVLFPLLLPWLPFKEFTAKGLVLGVLAAMAPIWAALSAASLASVWPYWVRAAGLALGLPPVTAYLALNFTGATPLTSPSWVEREMRRYIPWLIGLASAGIICLLTAGVAHWVGGGRWLW